MEIKLILFGQLQMKEEKVNLVKLIYSVGDGEMSVKDIRQRFGSSWLQYLPLIIYIKHLIYQSMSSRKSITPPTDNNQCNCFGNYIHNHQYFLTKYNPTQNTNKSNNSHLPTQKAQTTSSKSNGKRSLRKNNSPQCQSPPHTFSRVKDEYYQTNQSHLQPNRQGRLTRQEQMQRSAGIIRHEQKYFTKPPQCNIRNNIISPVPTYKSPLTPLPVSPQRTIITHSTPPPIRINFRTSSPQQLITSSNPTPQSKILISKSIKYENKLKQSSNSYKKQEGQNAAQQQIIQFQLTEDNLDSPRMMPVNNRVQRQQPKKKTQNKHNKLSQYFGFTQTFKSNIDGNHTTNKQTSKSIIPKKNTIKNSNEYQFDSPHQFKKEKGSLKKINDVQETHSLPNSDEEVEDDKESVVLGRLHEYGSAINPSNSFSPTMGSKLVSMNTQSSIGKSYLKSFEFHCDKRQ